eukprot:414874-Prymnesium_polylepis.1
MTWLSNIPCESPLEFVEGGAPSDGDSDSPSGNCNHLTLVGGGGWNYLVEGVLHAAGRPGRLCQSEVSRFIPEHSLAFVPHAALTHTVRAGILLRSLLDSTLHML